MNAKPVSSTGFIRSPDVRAIFTHQVFFTGSLFFTLIVSLLLAACQPGVLYRPRPNSPSPGLGELTPESTLLLAPGTSSTTPTLAPMPPPFPTRPLYSPGELVDYIAQSGDTLPALAVRFNTTVAGILEANPFIPASATTMPPGMPMKIPIYYLPLWGSPYRIIPDSLFINGPAQVGFDTGKFVAAHPGWLKGYVGYASNANRSGAEIVDFVARNFSVSPRLLLALLEYQAGALSQPTLPPEKIDYPLDYQAWDHKGLYLQLTWAANALNNGYYGYRTNQLTSIEFRDGRLERFDPWQNAASIALHYYFNLFYPYSAYDRAISPDGFAQTYQDLFGDPWQFEQSHIPGSLAQPEFNLPFEPGKTWAFTGGPHTGWGQGNPLSALDFAPPAVAGGCQPTSELALAVADGVVVRSELGQVMLDLDGDGDERTGWEVFYLHIGTEGRAPLGAKLKKGDPIGYPSCEGGSSTGTHVHLARKYNGEWIPADGVLAFNLEGWIAHNGNQPYQGTLTRFSQTTIACQCSNRESFIQSENR